MFYYLELSWENKADFSGSFKSGYRVWKRKLSWMLRWLPGRTGMRVLLWFEFPAGAKIDRTDSKIFEVYNRMYCNVSTLLASLLINIPWFIFPFINCWSFEFSHFLKLWEMLLWRTFYKMFLPIYVFTSLGYVFKWSFWDIW